MYQRRPLAVVNPPLRCEVSGLCTVEAVVETSVVAKREGDDELSSLLDNLQGAQRPELISILNEG